RARLPECGQQQQEHHARKRQRKIGGAEERRPHAAVPYTGNGADADAERGGNEDGERADAQGNAGAMHQSGPDVPPQAVGAERVKDAVKVGGQRRKEAGGDDVALLGGADRGDERGENRQQGHDEQHQQPEASAAVAKDPLHADSGARSRGSTRAAPISARMLPVTTSTALIAVAAMTTG